MKLKLLILLTALTGTHLFAEDQPPLAAPQKTLLIVAPAKFETALRSYVNFKSAFLPTQLVTLEQTLRTGHGVDDPEKLKSYLYDTWRRTNPSATSSW